MKHGIDEILAHLLVMKGNMVACTAATETVLQRPSEAAMTNVLTNTPSDSSPNVRFNVKLNASTVLAKVLEYPAGTVLQYPETSATHGEHIGHIIVMSSESWYNPARDFAYSRGSPNGSTGKNLLVSVLVDEQGNRVPCTEYHATCMF